MPGSKAEYNTAYHVTSKQCRAIKVVSDAFSQVYGDTERDGFISLKETYDRN